MPPLFPNAHEVKTTLDGAGFEVVSFLSKLWEQFSPYADSNFGNGIRDAVQGLRNHPTPGTERSQAFSDLQQRFWEMYVCCALLDQGVNLVPRQDWDPRWQGAGPDLQATVDNRRVWIECVAPGPGTGDDRVAQLGEELQIAQVQDQEIQLRVLSALKNKRDQHNQHSEADIVTPGDGFVVALNLRCVPLADLPADPPWIVRALYGVGDLALNFSYTGDRLPTTQLARQRHVLKANGSEVSTDLFGCGEAPEVSGLLFSNVDPWNRGVSPLGSNLTLLHNRTATVPLPDRWLPRSTSYAVTVNGNVSTITRTDPEPPRDTVPLTP